MVEAEKAEMSGSQEAQEEAAVASASASDQPPPGGAAPCTTGDVAAGKSHGVPRVSELKHRLDDLRAAMAPKMEMSGSQEAAIASPSIQLEASVSQSDDEIVMLNFELEALEIVEDIGRVELIRKMHDLHMVIRQFHKMVSKELAGSKSSKLSTALGELDRGKSKLEESNGTCILKDLVDKVREIESQVQALEEEYRQTSTDHHKLYMCLADIEAKRAIMDVLMHKMKQFEELGGLTMKEKEGASDDEEAANCGMVNGEISPLPSLVIPILPPLPHIEITQAQSRLTTVNSESDISDSDSSSSSGTSEVDKLQDLYTFEGPYWEALTAPVIGLASNEEEEYLMMEGSSLLGSDKKAKKIIATFDESEMAVNHMCGMLGQAVDRRGELAVSRDFLLSHFLLSLPLLYLCREKKDRQCPICKYGFPAKDHCVRLPCSHFFHVKCILQWLLRKNTCPMCRCQYPVS